jgi:intracellular sulfur oxidation DsrE/DsrF family protein
MDRRGIFGLLAAAFAVTPAVLRPASAATGSGHRLAIHVDQNDPAVMNLALGNAHNVAEYYQARGEEVSIEIVAYSQGLHMLRQDTSPVKDRIAELRKQIAGLSFAACGNTKRRMEQTEGKPMTLIPGAIVVPAGVVRLMELQEQGWSYVRP